MRIATIKQMREMDRTAIETFGIPDLLLMENAGLACYEVLKHEMGVAGGKFLVFCGLGNNGGDGFVIARKIHSNGGRVKVFLLGEPSRYQGSARANLNILEKLDIDYVVLVDAALCEMDLAHCDAVVDAIFGTGLTREVEGRFADVIQAINGSGKPVLSVDIPSGVDGDFGRVMGVAVQADYTVTFGLPKLGNLLLPGHLYGGKLFVSHISFPPTLLEWDELKTAVNDPGVCPPRDPDGHKGSFGQALVVAGAASYFGAPLFSALSFLRAGGGYSRLATPASMIPHLAAKGSEIVFLPQKETAAGSLALSNASRLIDVGNALDVALVGPGMSLDEETQTLVRELTQRLTKPLILDGDGITALCGHLQLIKARSAPTILTPHPGEMARLAGITVKQVKQDKIGVLRAVTQQTGAVVVLKGAHTLIGCPDGRVFINLSGNDGMATAGSGDVLGGAIAAMLGLGMSPVRATQKGVYLHGVAGDLAAVDKGKDGMTAQDILDHLPAAMGLDRQSGDEVFAACYAGARVV